MKKKKIFFELELKKLDLDFDPKLYLEYSKKYPKLSKKYPKLSKKDKIQIKKIKNELKQALIDEFIASRQYFIDSRDYKSDQKIKNELEIHSREEDVHADMIILLLRKINEDIPKFYYPKIPGNETNLTILYRNLHDELKAVEDYEIMLKKIDRSNNVYTMIKSILDDEKEHVKDLNVFIDEITEINT